MESNHIYFWGSRHSNCRPGRDLDILHGDLGMCHGEYGKSADLVWLLDLEPRAAVASVIANSLSLVGAFPRAVSLNPAPLVAIRSGFFAFFQRPTWHGSKKADSKLRKVPYAARLREFCQREQFAQDCVTHHSFPPSSELAVRFAA